MKHDRKKTHVIPNSLDFKIRELCSRFDSESAKKMIYIIRIPNLSILNLFGFESKNSKIRRKKTNQIVRF